MGGSKDLLLKKVNIVTDQAITLQKEGKFAESSDEFKKCAQLMISLIEEASTPEEKRKSKQLARKYLEHAKTNANKAHVVVSSLTKIHALPIEEPEFASPEEKALYWRIISLLKKTEITWNDIKGLNSVIDSIRMTFAVAGATLREGVKKILPNAIMLYGPPGTGKTLLAAAASNELEVPFFSVEIGSLLSKYVGESPQLVAALFKEARRMKRSLIFFDEFESLVPSKDKEISEHASSVLAALKTGWAGIDAKSMDSVVYTITATNYPWDIEDAVRSRLGKPVYIPLPGPEARSLILKSNIEKNGYSCDMPYETLVEKTHNYSGRELGNLCAEATLLMFQNNNRDDLNTLLRGGEARIRPISEDEMTEALRMIRPVTNDDDIKRYEKFAKEGK